MAEAPPFKILLATTNFLILVVLLGLVYRHIRSHNDLKSWSVAYHVLCFVWLTLRGAFWVMTIVSHSTWDAGVFYFLYWVPSPLQFASFMLLPIFFAQVLHPRLFKNHWHQVRPFYIIFICGLVGFVLIWSLVGAVIQTTEYQCMSDKMDDDSAQECYHMELSSTAVRCLTAVCFVMLAVIQGLNGVKLLYLDPQQHVRLFNWQPGWFAVVNAVLVFCFGSRGVYMLGTIFDWWHLPSMALQGGADLCFVHFFVFELWEYLPTMLLIITVSSRSIGSARGAVGVSKSLPDFGVLGEIKASSKGSHFSRNPAYRGGSISGPGNTAVSTPKVGKAWPWTGLGEGGSVFHDPHRYWRGSAAAESSPIAVHYDPLLHPPAAPHALYINSPSQYNQYSAYPEDKGQGIGTHASPPASTTNLRPYPRARNPLLLSEGSSASPTDAFLYAQWSGAVARHSYGSTNTGAVTHDPIPQVDALQKDAAYISTGSRMPSPASPHTRNSTVHGPQYQSRNGKYEPGFTRLPLPQQSRRGRETQAKAGVRFAVPPPNWPEKDFPLVTQDRARTENK